MKSEKIYLISPREPCGATWLINCLLELGVKTYRKTSGGVMWIQDGDKWVLNPVENLLKKWLPALEEHAEFDFRRDIEVEWTHSLPTKSLSGQRVIYFVRDPRDALFSRYRREAPEAAFSEFLKFPDPRTLLDKVDYWVLFNEAWLAQPNLQWFRFEDYKQDAIGTLLKILDYMKLQFSDSLVEKAVEYSSFQRASASEEAYRKKNPFDSQIINRASKIGSWQDAKLDHEISDIVTRCKGLMCCYGYIELSEPVAPIASFQPQAQLLSYFQTLALPSAFSNRPADGAERSREENVLDHLAVLEPSLFQKHRFAPYDQWLFCESAQEFLSAGRISHEGSVNGLINIRKSMLLLNVVKWRIVRFFNNRGIVMPAFARRMASLIRNKFRLALLKEEK